MFDRRFVGRLVCLLFTVMLLSACGTDLGLDPKEIGVDRDDQDAQASELDNTFVLRFAYRRITDTTDPDAENTVQIQGVLNDPNNTISNYCSDDGSKCECIFYKDELADPLIGTEVTYQPKLNVFNCEFPSSQPSAYTFVVLRTTDGETQSNILRILDSSNITLSEILGEGASEDNVRKIFRYTCSRRFLAGNGVTPAAITCIDQLLEFLEADYHYYFYENLNDPSDTNRGNRLTSDTYNDGAAVCSIPSLFRNQCNGSDSVRYGLYAEETTLFTAQIRLATSPLFFPVAVGFAAETGENGDCPPGLDPIRQQFVAPGTYTVQPSNFVNSDGSLNDIVLEESGFAQTDFTLNRTTAAADNCAAGACTAPTLDAGANQTIPYEGVGSTVCAIPQRYVQ